MSTDHRCVRPLANDFVTIFESPDPQHLFTGSPGVTRLHSGRLVVTFNVRGPAMASWPGPTRMRYNEPTQTKVFTSDDGGATWTHRVDLPCMMARPFMAGGTLYVLGLAEDLQIARSDDHGQTWSAPSRLTEGEDWTAAPCNVHYANDCVYLVMMQRPYPHRRIWPVSVQAPVLLRGSVSADLTRHDNWTFASSKPFRDIVTPAELDWFGVPFFESRFDTVNVTAPGRGMAPIGWLESNVVQFRDPDHLWYDPSGRTFHLWMRAHTGGTGYAAIAKVVEQGDHGGSGEMETMLETVPSGKTVLYVPCPGGQMKFHVLYDQATRLFWLLSTQATDSMIRPEDMPADRYNLPNNERRRLQLHFSKNMIDWCFAGLVAVGPVEVASRHYASMAIDGEALVVLSRSGSEHARNAHDGDIVTCHRIERFRDLVY